MKGGVSETMSTLRSSSMAFMLGKADSMMVTSRLSSRPCLRNSTRSATSSEPPMALVASTLPFKSST